MNILVTGGFGELGRRCAESLYKEGYKVILLGRKLNEEKWSKKFEKVIIDIRDEELHEKLRGKSIDCVIHFAGVKREFSQNEPKIALDINVRGTLNLLEACKGSIKKFIYISTFHIYGKQTENSWVDETVMPWPVNNYGMTKYMGELILKRVCYSNNIDGIILRVSNVYDDKNLDSDSVWSRVPNIFIKQAVKNKKIELNSSGKQIRNFIYFDDVLEMIRICLEKNYGEYQVFNVGSDENLRIKDIVNLVQKSYKEIFNEEIFISTGYLNNGENDVSYNYNINKALVCGLQPQNQIERVIRNNMMYLVKINNMED